MSISVYNQERRARPSGRNWGEIAPFSDREGFTVALEHAQVQAEHWRVLADRMLSALAVAHGTRLDVERAHWFNTGGENL